MQDEVFSTYSFLLNRTARRVKQYAQKRFTEFGFGITVDQWGLLKVLYEHGAASQNDLAKQTFKDNPTLTRMIDLLCDKQLVIREIDEADRRKFRLSLTHIGREKVEGMKPQVAEIRSKAWENLTPQDFAQFKHVLDTIYKNLEV